VRALIDLTRVSVLKVLSSVDLVGANAFDPVRYNRLNGVQERVGKLLVWSLECVRCVTPPLAL
jgi:hypothetical protein